MLVRQAERLAGGIDEFRARFAVRLVCARDFGNAFSDQRMRDDELRFAVVAAFRDVERVEKLSHVLAFDFLDIKAVRLHPLPVSSHCVSFAGHPA
jgi:FPC/CPF motif-containing protein YcgG